MDELYYDSSFTGPELEAALRHLPEIDDAVLRAETASRSAAADAAQVHAIVQGPQGYFATAQALREAVPQGFDGAWAVVGETDTFWVWDGDTAAWCDAEKGVDLSGYYTRAETDALVEGTAGAAQQAATAAAQDAAAARTAADTAASQAEAAQQAAAAAMPLAGGTFTGDAAACSENRATAALRNIEVRITDTAGELQATDKIILVRK